MEHNEKIIVGNDTFTWVKEPHHESALGGVFAGVVCARCESYPYPFQHEHNITFLALTGALLFEINGVVKQVDKLEYIDVGAGASYRFRSLEREPTAFFAFAPSHAVAESWRQVGVDLRSHAKLGRDGITRFV